MFLAPPLVDDTPSAILTSLNCQSRLTWPSLWPMFCSQHLDTRTCVCVLTLSSQGFGRFLLPQQLLCPFVSPLVSELLPRAVKESGQPMGHTFFSTHKSVRLFMYVNRRFIINFFLPKNSLACHNHLDADNHLDALAPTSVKHT